MKNKLKILLFVSTLLVFSTAFSKTFLFEISNNTDKLYILGSIHVGNESMYPLNKHLISAFKNSDCLAVEVDATNPENSAKMRNLIRETGMITNNKTVKDIISPKLYGELQNEFEKLGLPESNFLYTKPWLTAISLLNMKVMQLGYKSEFGIDLFFINEAKKTEKPIKELESVEYQIKMLANLPKKLQCKLLESALDRTTNYDKLLKDTITYWKTGNTKAFEKMYFEEIYKADRYKDLVEIIFYKRNKHMAEKINNFLKQKEKCFVIIGAGHLLGKKGILNLLKLKGYKVKQL
jgi:uncharacterized protein YbaP (TraB family)